MKEKPNNFPIISVIMPVYNAACFVGDAIESILTQSYQDFEFIIINDASTDKSEEIILKYNDPRIIYDSNSKNEGIVKVLNKGLNKARGIFIARMDADDIALPSRFEKQIEFLHNNKHIAACGCSISYFNEEGIIKSWIVPTNRQQIELQLLAAPSMPHPTVIIRKEIMDSHKLSYSSLFPHAEDYELWQRMIMCNLEIGNLQEVLLNYRKHDTNVSNVFNSIQLSSTIALQERMISYFLQRTLTKSEIDLLHVRNEPFQGLDFLITCNELVVDFIDATRSRKGWNQKISRVFLTQFLLKKYLFNEDSFYTFFKNRKKIPAIYFFVLKQKVKKLLKTFVAISRFPAS